MTGADSVSGVLREPFTLAGPITHWNFATRELTVLGRDMMLIPHLSTVGLEVGRQVVVAGYHDTSTGQTIVTRLHLP